MVTHLWMPSSIPQYHGALGVWDEALCFAALVVIALAVFVVYGRDLLKPAAARGGEESSRQMAEGSREESREAPKQRSGNEESERFVF